MTTIYYFSTIIFLFIEIAWIISPIEKTKDAKKFKYLAKLHKGKKWEDMPEEYRTQIKSKIWLVYVFIWMFVGLFTFQWIAFLLMLIFNFIIIDPLSKLFNHNFLYTVLHCFNSWIGFAFGVFIIVNHYHLKLNLTEIIFSYLK